MSRSTARIACWPSLRPRLLRKSLVAATALAAWPVLPSSAKTAAANAGTVQLDVIDVQAQPSARAIDTPPGTTGYVATRETAATKTDTPVREVPQSISTVTREQLNDRDVQTLNQVIQYTPGASTNVGGALNDFDRIFIRGFSAITDVYRDNLRQGGNNFGVPKVEPYGLESAQILRGPASGLYGLGSTGGIVDVITKRPTLNPFGELQLQVGQYNRYQGNFDLGGPVVGLDSVTYRLTGLFREANTYLPGENDNRAYFAPAVRWQPDADTSITLLGEYQQSRTSGNNIFYTDANHRALYYANDPRFGAFDQEQYRIGYEYEHRFNDFLTVRQNFRFYHVTADSKFTLIDSVDDAAQTAQRSVGRDRDNFNSVALDNQALLHAWTGPVEHTLLLGLSYNHYFNVSKYGTNTVGVPDLDLRTLNYGAQAIAPVTPADYFFIDREHLDEEGLYAQEQARWGGFVLTLNGQQSWVQRQSINIGSTVNADESAFTGRAGLAYLFDNGVSPYVSYATSYSPQLGASFAGTPFPSLTAEQEEGGVKYQLPTLPVLLTAAVFNITADNVLRSDAANFGFQVATGRVESQGVELEANVALAEGFNLIAAYSHLATRNLRTNDDTTGKQFSGIPEDSASVFAKYTFQPGSAVAGLGIGGGVRYIGSSFGDDQNTFRNADVALVDAVADYDLGQADPRFQGLRLQINATNLLDTRYQACQSGYCGIGEGQQVIGSAIYRF